MLFLEHIFNWKRTFDVSEQSDNRNLDYPVSNILQTAPKKLVSKKWECPVRLNQGREGACVGFGLTHMLASQPNPHSFYTNQCAFNLYHQIKLNDRLAGENYDGTWIEDGLRLLKKQQKIKSYHWAMKLDDSINAISNLGPLVCKIPTYEGFYRPLGSGQMKHTGKMVGWHCILADEVDVENERVWFLNSWGKLWGKSGRAWMSFDDVKYLLNQGMQMSYAAKH